MKKKLLWLFLIIFVRSVYSQGIFEPTDNGALEGLYVEKIPVSAAAIAADANLTNQHFTYRVFVDMKDSFSLKSVFGYVETEDFNNLPLVFSTTTKFYNDIDNGAGWANEIRPLPTMDKPVYYDSWLTLGVYSSAKYATQLVPIEDDTVGAKDGFMGAGLNFNIALLPGFSVSEFEVDALGESYFRADADKDNYMVLEGVNGADSKNRVCIGQFTTNGVFSCKINVLLVNIIGGKAICYVHSRGEVAEPNIGSDKCVYPMLNKRGCMDSKACNFDPEAKEADNGTCKYAEDNCQKCIDVSPYYEKIDTDKDGICDADEIKGCKDPKACNYNPSATDIDNETCLFVEDSCTYCAGGKLVMIDFNNNGVCNKYDTKGCTDPLSCNYNKFATESDNSCNDHFEANCVTCDIFNGNASFIGDCQRGCTDEKACNYNPNVLIDDGSCIIPTKDCQKCVNGAIVDECVSIIELPNNLLHCSINPNPVDDNATVHIENLSSSAAITIVLKNTLGEIMYRKSIEVKGSINHEISMSSYAQGVYFLSLISENQTLWVSKLIKK
ncbi:MAG: T9SS type A sorting domain-containing protein [Bacteroidales bacterium]|nr:T9SS type A sorting domain-containing protein [Bacteroidales bacterium]